MEETSLETLIKLTPELPKISLVGEGSFMWENVSVEKGFIPAKTELPERECRELHIYYFVIEGSLVFTLKSRTKYMAVGDHIHILPDEPYRITALKDARYIYVAFPPNGVT